MCCGLSPCKKVKTFCIVQNIKQKTVWKQNDTINTKQDHYWHRNVSSMDQTNTVPHLLPSKRGKGDK